MANQQSPLHQTWRMVTRLGQLYLDSARINLAEKLTRLFSMLALGVIALIMGICVMAFLTLAIADLLLSSLAPCWVYLIICGCYVLLLALIYLFRLQLIVNPFARFISSLIVNPPKSNNDEQQ